MVGFPAITWVKLHYKGNNYMGKTALQLATMK